MKMKSLASNQFLVTGTLTRDWESMLSTTDKASKYVT